MLIISIVDPEIKTKDIFLLISEGLVTSNFAKILIFLVIKGYNLYLDLGNHIQGRGEKSDGMLVADSRE